MDSERWKQLESIFFAALELAPEERATYLDDACAGNAALRAELNAVLAAHSAAGQTLNPAPTQPAPGSNGALTGTRIGAYRLEELVGRGGMGEVYRALRVDEEYHHEVAIKLIRSGLDVQEMIRRFRVERQILANLQHPNIATLLEGGVTPDGQPYLVMQFVRGMPITAYADQRGLSIVERLRLFRTVCEAVQYAHTNLVVHRDLKPSNIVVTDDGQVRLLDFGIAKLLDPHKAGLATDLTGDLLLFTPEHAAPEQLQRKPVTAATDVYALGVLLYELLTGIRPFHGDTPIELYQAVCDREPTRPSVALAARPAILPTAGTSDAPARTTRLPRTHSLIRQVRGDLDLIVLMALRKEPERRYASAGQFSDDVSSYLQGRPVRARPASFGYRARKFVGRNRAASLAALSLLAGLVGTTWQARRAGLEAARASADRDRAEHVSALLVDVFRIADPGSTRGRTVTAREILGQGAARMANQLADQPAAQADLHSEIGQIYRNLGLLEDADAQLSRALALRRSVMGNEHPDVAQSMIRLAELRTNQGRAAEGLELARAAAILLRKRGGPRRPHPALADALIALGTAALNIAGKPATPDAVAALAEAAAVLEKHAEPDDPRLATAYFRWADAAHNQGRFDLADSLLQQNIARYERLGNTPHPDAASSLSQLGMLRMYRRRPADAEPLLRKALEMRRKIYGTYHPEVAETLYSLASSLALLGRYVESVPLGEEAMVVADSTLGKEHATSLQARISLGSSLPKVDQGERAVQILEETLATLRAQAGAGHPRAFGVEVFLTQAYLSMGQTDRARDLFTDILRRVDTTLGPEHAFHAHVTLELGRLDFEAGRLNDAETKAQQSLALTRKVLRTDHRFALWATTTLARVQAARGQLRRADSLLRDVLATQRKSIGADHPETATTLVDLADLETRQGKPNDAEREARAAIAVFEAHQERGPALAEARSVLGGALAAQGRTAEAEPLLRSALADLNRARGARPSQQAGAARRLREFTRGAR